MSGPISGFHMAHVMSHWNVDFSFILLALSWPTKEVTRDTEQQRNSTIKVLCHKPWWNQSSNKGLGRKRLKNCLINKSKLKVTHWNYISTYRSSVGRYVDRDVSLDMSADISVKHRSICRLTLDRYVGRYVGQEWLPDCRPTCRSIGYRHFADTSLLLVYWWL